MMLDLKVETACGYREEFGTVMLETQAFIEGFRRTHERHNWSFTYMNRRPISNITQGGGGGGEGGGGGGGGGRGGGGG